MKKQKRLLFARNIFVFIIFVIFGVIIVTEKSKGILIPKAKEEMIEYIENNYKEIKDNLLYEEPTFNNHTYQMKITSKENKNLFFYIKKNRNKITSTYKKDYLEGSSLLNTLPTKLEKQIKEETNTEVDVSIISTLDKYTSAVQKRIIEEDNLLNLKFYYIEKELLISSWDSKTITDEITSLIEVYKNKNITPKTFVIIITNKNKIKESIKLNVSEDFLENKNKVEIINDIIEKNNSKLLKESNITYKYLNEEEMYE